MTLSRRVQAAAHRLADAQSDRLADRPTTRFRAVVASVTAGAARDGNAVVKIRWRGQELTVNGYADNYTPAAGHRVVCDYLDNQITIAYRTIGAP
ncbi:hypothetical protein [Geodermatophilus chilensis]|uniref:hypothetical protein n=1 Tax=Geodermatophilus chilensis TaxID=2035835 RepID=UPI000C260CF8|nr:hypothetical protein [Geodermatophilus chilensis]